MIDAVTYLAVDREIELPREHAAAVHKLVKIGCSENVGASSLPIYIAHVCGTGIGKAGLIQVVFKLGGHEDRLQEKLVGAAGGAEILPDKVLFRQQVFRKAAGYGKPVGTAVEAGACLFEAVCTQPPLDRKKDIIGLFIKAVLPAGLFLKWMVKAGTLDGGGAVCELLGAEMDKFRSIMLLENILRKNFEKPIAFLGDLWYSTS